MSNETENKYKYPVGDFLSGFSDDQNNPCDYELECQRMTIRGVEYLDKNLELFDRIGEEKLGPYDSAVRPMADFMIEGGDQGQTGAMVEQSIRHAYHAKKIGWDAYVEKIVSSRDEKVKEEGEQNEEQG